MKKFLAAILSLALILSSLSLSAFAGSDKSSVTGWSRGNKYYYTDSYFADKASAYNPSLSTMSMLLSRAGDANSADNWSHQYDSLFSMFSQLGFTDAEVNDDFNMKPSEDSMGVGAAHKTITINGRKCTLLAVVPRGNYAAEWASNFTLGTSGEAEGFSNSAAKIESFLADYVNKYGSRFEGELKLWIVGFSRGAAVANLVAGHISAAGKLGSLSVSRENVYGYTFETPAATNTDVISLEEAESYTNIHNIISANDLVTKVAPEKWGFLRYGTDESVIPEKRTAENEALFEAALTFLPDKYKGYTADGKQVFATELFQAERLSLTASTGKAATDKSMSEVLDDFVTATGAAVLNRTGYTLMVQDTFRLVLSEVCGEGIQSEGAKAFFTSLKTQLQDHVTDLLRLAVTARESDLSSLLTDIFDTALAVSGLDSGAYAALPGQLMCLVPILVSTILADVVIDGGADILSLIDNLDCLQYPHKVDQVLAWLKAQDHNYNPAAAAKAITVENVQVNIQKVTEKKGLLGKLTVTHYETTIQPIANGEIRKVEYRQTLIGYLTEGTFISQSLKPTYFYINVTDGNGNVTHWEYKNGAVKQVNR